MIDLHTHLLPGVDDGSPSAEHSAIVIARLAGEGVTAIVCTPHLNASAADRAPVEEHLRLLEDLRGRATSEVTLHSGWEIMLDRPGADLTQASLALGGSKARLVEFPRRGLPPGSTDEIVRLRRDGLVPVVAHPERYVGCTVGTIDGWREFGAVIQADAMALLGGGTMTEFAREMLALGLVDVLASDNHGDRRTLSTARQWLVEIGAGEQAELLTVENPARVLRDESPVPVPPVRLQQGVFDRLRALVFGRR